MAGYFSSLTDNFIIESDPLNRTITEARNNLRSILSSTDIRIRDFSNERSFLTTAIANSELLLNKKKEEFNNISVETFIAARNAASNVRDVTSNKKSVNDLNSNELNIFDNGIEILKNFQIELDEVISDIIFLSKNALNSGQNILINLNDSFNREIDNISNVIFGGISFVNDTKDVIFLSIKNKSSDIVNSIPTTIDAISLFWDNNIATPISNFFSKLATETNKVWNNFVSAPIFVDRTLFDDGVAAKQLASNIDNYLRSNRININAYFDGKTQTFRDNGFIATAVELGSDVISFTGGLLNDGWGLIKGWDWLESTGAPRTVENIVGGAVRGVNNAGNNILSFFSQFISGAEFKATIDSIGQFLGGIFPSFRDGVTETRFGYAMENSWIGGPNSFLDNLRTINVSILTSTPLDESEGSNKSLYGNMMLGVPFAYTEITDPNNRVMINTFVKDSVFLSLTPGMPKYNGGAFQQEVLSSVVSATSVLGPGATQGALNLTGLTSTGSYLNQTQTADQMIAYLLKNGMDKLISEKDKRYYVFEAKYQDYFAYLETMLNTLWVKMGLGTAEDGSINIFSFFNPTSKDSDYDSSLLEKYKSSIGFYVNPVGNVSEAITNSPLSTDLASDANSASDEFQRLNYITGMGTGGDARNAMRQVGIASQQTKLGINLIKNNFSAEGKNIVSKMLNLGKSIVDFSNTQDMSALVQQFTVTNGMKVMYPMLWESSNYNKNMSFTFNFVSPYGDPLSIFQYVYVPFFSLLAFAIPRQAAENGLVSPLFVRADIPGVITSDLAMITDLTWTKGEEASWTKDKLPRSISGSFQITDLYPYLAAVKRLSFLSANPSFTVFLDNMAGLRALYNNESDPYEEYWRKLVNRVSGQELSTGLWNVFNSDRQVYNNTFGNIQRRSLTRTINSKAAPWLSKS
jgi:hypothetical protein